MKLSKTAIKLIKWASIISVVGFLALFYFFINNLFSLAIGMGIGFFAAVLRTVHLDLSLAKLEQGIEFEASAAKRMMTVGLFSRQLIMLAALFVSVYFFGAVGLIGATVGFLSIRLAAFFVKVPDVSLTPQLKGGEDTDGL